MYICVHFLGFILRGLHSSVKTKKYESRAGTKPAAHFFLDHRKSWHGLQEDVINDDCDRELEPSNTPQQQFRPHSVSFGRGAHKTRLQGDSDENSGMRGTNPVRTCSGNSPRTADPGLCWRVLVSVATGERTRKSLIGRCNPHVPNTPSCCHLMWISPMSRLGVLASIL